MTLTRHPLLTAALLLLCALATLALLELLTGAVARGGDDQPDTISAASPNLAIDAGVVTPTPPPAPPAAMVPAPPDTSEIVRLWRGGYVAAAVALGLHRLLGVALVRWAWVVAFVPPLGRWRWRAIASSALATMTVTIPAAVTGQLTWPGLIWPLLVGVALAFLPGPPAQAQAQAT